MNSKRTFQTICTMVTMGALALSITRAQAQVVSMPYGGSEAGNGYYQFAPSAYIGVGMSPYSSFGVTNGFNGFYGMPLGNANGNIRILDSPYGYGGFVTINPDGGVSVIAPEGAYNLYPSLSGLSGDNSANTEGRNDNPQNPTAQNNTPMSLTQQIGVQRDNSYGFVFNWRDDPSLLQNMTVTLLNRYHLPITSGASSDGSPITFAGNAKTYAARYYRVDITYADGAVTSMMGIVHK